MLKKAISPLAFVVGAILAAVAPAYAAPHTFTVVNHAQYKVTVVKISPENTNRWGPNLLGVETLKRGGTIGFLVKAPCLEDVLVVYGNGVKEWHRNTSTCNSLVLTYHYP